MPAEHAKCYDCGLPYSKHGLDISFSDEQWAMICDGNKEINVLCGTCMATRCREQNTGSVIKAVIE